MIAESVDGRSDACPRPRKTVCTSGASSDDISKQRSSGEIDSSSASSDGIACVETRTRRAAAEDADITFQISEKLRPLLKEKGQGKVFYDIESPLIAILVAIESEGISLNCQILDKIQQR